MDMINSGFYIWLLFLADNVSNPVGLQHIFLSVSILCPYMEIFTFLFCVPFIYKSTQMDIKGARTDHWISNQDFHIWRFTGYLIGILYIAY